MHHIDVAMCGLLEQLPFLVLSSMIPLLTPCCFHCHKLVCLWLMSCFISYLAIYSGPYILMLGCHTVLTLTLQLCQGFPALA